MARITKALLERRTQSLEKALIRVGLHPGQEYKLMLDYNTYYGYKLVWVGPKGGEYHFWLAAQRLTASEMDSYQQGLFDILSALPSCHENTP